MAIWCDDGPAIRLTGDLDHIEDAVDAAMTVPYIGLSGGAKADALDQVLRIGAKITALQAKVLTAFEVTAEHRHEGHTSVVAWAKTHRHAHGPDIARLRRTAHHLNDLPRAQAALQQGLITDEHVTVLHRAHRLLGPQRFRFVEEPLLDAAIRERFIDFEQTVDYTIVRAAPADADERARRRHDERHASSSPLGDHGRIDADLDRDGFQIWQTELDRLMAELLAADRAEARDRLGRAPTANELRRTTRQRRADAMVEMARRSANHNGDDLGAGRYVTNIHVDPAFLTALIATLTRALNPGHDPGFDLDTELDRIELGAESLHELDDGTVLTVNTVVFALLTGTIRGILYDPRGEVLRYGRERRLFSPAQAQAIFALSRRCGHPYGCDRTGPRTQADHLVEHQDGGPTDLTNGGRKCDHHNLWKTNHRHDLPPPDTRHRRTPRRLRPDTDRPDTDPT